MSKTLKDIQAELAAQTSVITPVQELAAQHLGATLNENGSYRHSDGSYHKFQEAPAVPKLSVAELLEQLSEASGVAVDTLLANLDRASAVGAPVLLPEGTRTYYTSVPNSGVMLQVGPAQCERIEFKGDTLHTTDPAAISYLDAIVDKAGSSVFSRSHRQVSAEQEQMRADLTAMAKAHHTKMVAAGQKVA